MTLEASVFAWKERFRDQFLLRGPERRVRALLPAQQESVRAHFDAARKRLNATNDLTDSDGASVAMSLYRDATVLLIASVLVARDASEDVSTLDFRSAWERLRALCDEGALGARPAGFDEAGTALSKSGPLAWDSVPPDDLVSARATVEEIVKWLQRLVEPRSIGEISRSRWLRIALASAASVAIVWWGLSALFSEHNVALQKPVKLSGIYAAASSPADGSGAVNGIIEPSYGVHTNIDDQGWILIDLEATYKISKVKIFNRGEEPYLDEGLPLILELSDDGQNFREIERRKDRFTQASPWVCKAGGAKARYVRVRNANRPSYIALSEIEVYGRK